MSADGRGEDSGEAGVLESGVLAGISAELYRNPGAVPVRKLAEPPPEESPEQNSVLRRLIPADGDAGDAAPALLKADRGRPGPSSDDRAALPADAEPELHEWHSSPITTWTLRSRLLFLVEEGFYYAFVFYICIVVLIGALALFCLKEKRVSRTSDSSESSESEDNFLLFLDSLYYAFSCVTQAGLSVSNWAADSSFPEQLVSLILMFLGSMPLLALIPPLLRRYNFRKQARTWRKIVKNVERGKRAPPQGGRRGAGQAGQAQGEFSSEWDQDFSVWAEWDHESCLEYRALGLIRNVVLSYVLGFLFLGTLGLVLDAWLVSSLGREGVVLGDAYPLLYRSFYLAVSAFQNNGLALTQNSMVPFQGQTLTLFCVSVLVLAGNTCFPIFLRYYLVLRRAYLRAYLRNPAAMRRRNASRKTAMLPTQGAGQQQGQQGNQRGQQPGPTDSNQEELAISTDSESESAEFLRLQRKLEAYDFLLTNPRRCFTHLFPSVHTRWLLLVVFLLNSVCMISMWWQDWGGAAFAGVAKRARGPNTVFQAIATRTAGFNSVDLGELSLATQFLLLLCMYVAASPTMVVMRQTSMARAIPGQLLTSDDLASSVLGSVLYSPYDSTDPGKTWNLLSRDGSSRTLQILQGPGGAVPGGTAMGQGLFRTQSGGVLGDGAGRPDARASELHGHAAERLLLLGTQDCPLMGDDARLQEEIALSILSSSPSKDGKGSTISSTISTCAASSVSANTSQSLSANTSQSLSAASFSGYSAGSGSSRGLSSLHEEGSGKASSSTGRHPLPRAEISNPNPNPRNSNPARLMPEENLAPLVAGPPPSRCPPPSPGNGSSSSSSRGTPFLQDESKAPPDLDITGRPEGVPVLPAEAVNSMSWQASRFLRRDVVFLSILIFFLLVCERREQPAQPAPPIRAPQMPMDSAQLDSIADPGLHAASQKKNRPLKLRVDPKVHSQVGRQGHSQVGPQVDDSALAPPYRSQFFKILFEVASAYGTVGLSLGTPEVPGASFSAEWRPVSKLILCLVMFLGKLRGLPEAIDPSVARTIGVRTP